MASARNAPIWVKLFVAFHVFAITVWALPPPPPAVRNRMVSPRGTDVILEINDSRLKPSWVSAYPRWTGFWQYWDMFSPDPAYVDYWGDAEVEFADGTVSRFAYPRMYDLSICQKYFKERYRKFFERVHPVSFQYMWPVFGQRVALECYRDPANPPTKVRLWRHFMVIPKPINAKPKEYSKFMFFEHSVDLEALREEGPRR